MTNYGDYGKSPLLIGKSTINGPFSIVFCMFTRGYLGLKMVPIYSWLVVSTPLKNISQLG